MAVERLTQSESRGCHNENLNHVSPAAATGYDLEHNFFAS